MPAAGRLLVLVNSRASRCDAIIGPALGALVSRGHDLDVRHPGSREGLDRVIREEEASVDAIVVAGGDGTINGALPSLIGAGKPVGILPLGTANDLALTLGVPTDPIAAAEIISGGHTRRIDVGRVNDVCFLNVASIGLSVQVARRQDERRKQQWRIFSYLLTTIEVLGEADRFRARIDLGSEQAEVQAYQIAVGNGVHYGGGMLVAENAAIDDGLLDVYAIESRSITDLIGLGPSLMAGRHGRHPDVSIFRSPSLRIETDRPMPVNTDGEVTTETPAEFSVDRGALALFAPPSPG